MTDQSQESTPLPSFDDFVAQQKATSTRFEDWRDDAQGVAEDVGKIASVPTVNTPVPPSVILDASGVPHVVIPLTKKTKAYVGTALAAVSMIGTGSALVFLPDNVKPWAAGAGFVAGLIATWMGIVLPANLPKRSDKV